MNVVFIEVFRQRSFERAERVHRTSEAFGLREEDITQRRKRQRAIAMDMRNILICKINTHAFGCEIARSYERCNDHSRAFARANDEEERAEFLCVAFSFVVVKTIRMRSDWDET